MDIEADVLYGDIVSFFNPETDTVLNIEGFCEESAYPLEYDRVKKAVLDWTGSLFVVEPKGSFSSREEFRSFVSENVLALFDQPYVNEGVVSELREQMTVRKNQMLQRVAFEVESAASNYDMHRGQTVKYGEPVQLRHVNSGRYFCVRSSANSAATEFAVVDSVDAVESSHWKFHSGTRHGGALKYAVESQLVSIVYDAMMAVEVGPSGPSTFKMISRVESLSTFKLVRIGADKFAPKCLCTGNAIYLSHFSSGAFLTSRYADYLTFYNLEKQPNIPDETRYLLTPARACFVVEGQDIIEPIHAKARSGDALRLRCICSGEIVALTPHIGPETESDDMFSDDFAKPMVACTLQASPSIVEDTAFHLVGIDDHANISDSCFQIVHVASNTNLAMSSRRGQSILAPNFGENGNSAFFKCAFADARAVVECRRLASYKSVFEYLIALIGLEVTMSSEFVSAATHHFEDLTRWLTEASPQLRLWRQEGLYDNGCVDLLRTLLGAPMEICKMPLSAIVKQQRYRHVCAFIGSCGTCIEALVFNCAQNGARFLSWIESLIEVMMCFDSIAKVVLACFMCSKGAMRVVKKQHIHTIIELSSGPARTRFFQSLSQLLLAGGEDSVSCQDYVLSKLFPSSAEREASGAIRAVVPIARAEGKNVVILDVTPDRVPQPLFNVVNAPALFSSFCGFLELADALCYNYCARAIKELLVIEVMPYKVGLIILNDPIAPYILKTRVLRLMHSLYILTMNSRGVDVSNVQVLIPWNMDSSVASYSIANLYPTHAEWESTIELQDIVLHTIENNDSLGFHSDKDAFTAVALSTAITFCRVGIFCMPIETLMKNSGPYIRSRAKAFFRAKTAERAKTLGVSADDLATMGIVGCQLLQLELLMQPLQMLLDTSTDNIKAATLQGVMSCKNEALRCMSVILGIRRHLEMLQTLKRFKEDIAASKISKNVDMLSFTPSATAAPPMALQLVGINMMSLPITLTNLFCHIQNTNRLAAIDLIIQLFMDQVNFFKLALRTLLMSDPLITATFRAVKDVIALMAQELKPAVAYLSQASAASGNSSSPSSNNSDTPNHAQAAEFALRLSQLSDVLGRPITSAASSEIRSKIHLVSRILGLPDVIMSALNDILSACAPAEMHEASRLTPRLRKVTPRPITMSSRFSGELHKKLVDSVCQIVVHMCHHNPVAQSFFFTQIDVFIRFLQFGRDENDVRAVFAAISAILEGNRDACFESQDTLVPDLIILLLRKGKWSNVLVVLRKCISFVDGSSMHIIQKLIMSSFTRNHVILVQLPFADSAVFSHRSLHQREHSTQYTIECMRLLAILCKDSPQNQSSVRSWIPIADVPLVVKSNLKNPGVVTNFIELVAAAYVVPTFDVSTEREPIDAILRVLNDIIDLFCSIHGIKVIGLETDPNPSRHAALVPKESVSNPSAAVSAIPSALLEASVSFYISMYKSNQAMTNFASSVAHVSSRLISIVCSRTCSMAQTSSIKMLLDRFFASRILPVPICKLYASLPVNFENTEDSDAVFVASDDSAASLWPYFLNQEYAAYLKDEDSCVSSLVKHFKEASFLNQNLEFEKHLIWAIQQPALPDETRTVLIKVTHELWKLEKRNWLVSNVRVVFSILCDLLMASSKSEKPSEVCMAAVFFCTDMLSCPETGRTFQGEFYDVMQGYGTLAIASIQYIVDVAVYCAEEYSRFLSSSKDVPGSQFNPADPGQCHLAFCHKMFLMLKSFCEGHFSDGQMFIGQYLGSSNVINLSTQLLCALASARTQLAESLQMSTLDLLVESIQGPCLANCEIALNSRIAAAFNIYIRAQQYSFEAPVVPSDIAMARLEKFCVFFQALLEETRADTRAKPLFTSAATFILMNADFAHLLAFIENACSLLSGSSYDIKPAVALRLRNLCCSIFVLLTYLGASDPVRPRALDPFCLGYREHNPQGRTQAEVARWQAFIAEFWNGIVSIEVTRDRCLCKVYFYSRASSTGERESKRVGASLDWSNEHPQGRLISFLKNIDQMRYELNHISRICTKPFLTLLMSMHGFFFYGRFISVLFINLLLILFYQYKTPEVHGDSPGSVLGELVTPSNLVEFARGPVVIFNMICYLYLLLHLIVIDGLPIIRARLRSALQIDSIEMRTILFRDCSLTLGLDFKGPFHIIQCILAMFSHVRFFILGCYCVLSLYLVSDFLNPFSTVAMSFFLLELLSYSSLVEMAVMSVTNRWRLLCQVSIGIILFVYWCSCVIYIFFIKDLEFSVSRVVDGDSPPYNQNEYYVAPRYLWKCFVFVMDNALRTQDIGKAFGIVESSINDEVLLKMPVARVFIRIAISFLFWFLFQVIFLRVFPGVISDTFKANRIKEQHIKSSRSTKCFICGLESHVFTLTGTTFNNHLRKEHAPYNYMRYFVYLAEKDPNEYNIEFLPVGTCLSLQAPTDPKDDGETLINGGTVVPAKVLANRLAAMAQRQKEIEADVDHRNAHGYKAALQSTSITEIRQQHQKRMETFKACPYMVQ